MDTALAIQYAQIGGIALGGVVALAVVVLIVGAVLRTLASYSAEKSKAAAKRAAADAERAASDAQARIAREKADSAVREMKARESGLLQQSLANEAAAAEQVRNLERRLSVVEAERDALAARLAAADADRIAERAAIAAAVVAGIVDATKDELIDLGPGTHRAVEPASPAGFTPETSGRASSWQSRATIPDAPKR